MFSIFFHRFDPVTRSTKIASTIIAWPLITVYLKCVAKATGDIESDFTWLGFIIIVACNDIMRLRGAEERSSRKREEVEMEASDSAAGCCIPESALMHGLGYVNSRRSGEQTRWVKRARSRRHLRNIE